MTKDTLQKLIEVMPLASDERFYLSCAYEPTIHPDFVELLEGIPKELKSKAMITTNLTNRLSIEQLEKLSNINLNTIQISVETFNPEMYEDFRAGAKYEIFIENLENLARIFKQNLNAPYIRFISMVFKQNIDQLESLMRTCNEKYLSTLNEFRTPFEESLAYNNPEWLEKSLITEQEWDDMAANLSKLPYRIKLFNPSKEIILFSHIDNQIIYNPEEDSTNINFFIGSDGTVFSPDKGSSFLPEEFKQDFNINDIGDPYNYFKNILHKEQAIE
jgi:MoaA/NifB/PqqE/SkfB family radical SAM enzyme